jgi:hypothetical protein
VTGPAVAPDTALPLDALLDPDTVTGGLRRANGPGAGTVVAAGLLDHKANHRALVRYRLEGAPVAEVLGKAYADPIGAARTWDLMVRLATVVFAGRPDFDTPRPVALVPELMLVLYVPVAGVPLDGLPVQVVPDALEAAAAWLAVLHQADLALDRVLDVDHEADNAGLWAAVVAERCPAAARQVYQLAAGLTQDLPPAPDALVPIHKDFHYQHVIVGERLGVVDLDEARMGDPAFDLAHFDANLHLLAGRSGRLDARDEWWRLFRAAYGRATGWEDDARLPWFFAYSCVKIAKQLATDRGPVPRPAGSTRDAEVARVIEAGVRAVGG